MASELSLRQILIMSRISALIGIREESSFRKEILTALSEKISVSILREVVLQSYLFAGYAAAINAFHIVNELVPGDSEFLIESDGSLEIWKARGIELCKRIYGDQYDKLLHNMDRLHPELSDWMIVEGYGKVLSRPILSPRVRELLIVGMTAALGVERQFHSHVRGALNVGATAEELRQVFAATLPLISTDAQERIRAILEKVLAPS